MSKKWTQLIDLRKAAGLSQYELARRLKMSRSALGNYEMGEREPDFETTQKLADFFGVSIDELLGRERIHRPVATEVVPPEWRAMIELARRDGYSPDQVLQALRLLDSIKRQQEIGKQEERDG